MNPQYWFFPKSSVSPGARDDDVPVGLGTNFDAVASNDIFRFQKIVQGAAYKRTHPNVLASTHSRPFAEVSWMYFSRHPALISRTELAKILGKMDRSGQATGDDPANAIAYGNLKIEFRLVDEGFWPFARAEEPYIRTGSLSG
ncbi:hypothetical protein D9619_012272 [Psilocybe cf. subviscida]|uniref:Uncharacterized protein n=1 Tax=Psilocybe cf. subviscida TaxID=2480587 RepID=A0A8H5B7I0_9AGAR|nr:hypothetical protein D9619_012272 [Psilocybe cf. subviscida]